jgi:IS30 family transposase
MTNTPKYVSPEVFQRFMNEAVGINISTSTLYRYLAQGEIRSAKINGYRIPISELNDYPERKLAESHGKLTDHPRSTLQRDI